MNSIRLMAMAFLLAACRSQGGDDEVRPDPTPQPEPQVVDTAGGVHRPIELASVERSTLPPLVSGLVVRCDEDGAEVTVQFVGAPGTAEATPIVDGQLMDAMPLTVEVRDLFHRATGSLSVDDCEATGWRVVVSSAGPDACVATGPGAEAAGEGCTLR